MKTTMKNLALLLLAAATGSSAWAQTQVVVYAGKAYTFTNTAVATGSEPITYQWYKNGVAIPGATTASYTLPGTEANGIKVEFKRGAVSGACPANPIFTNPIYITFCGLLLGSVCWATCNVHEPNTFAVQPDVYTSYYQWSRNVGWPVVDPLGGTWPTASISEQTWNVNPCPTGWRLPTNTEFTALVNSNSTWVDAGTRGAAVAGRFYGPNHATPTSCSLTGTMDNCVFLPASGQRSNTGALSAKGTNGYYWTSYGTSTTVAYLTFTNTTNTVTTHTSASVGTLYRPLGYSIRCVQDMAL